MLLVGLRPLFAILVGFAFAVILAGSTRLKVALQLDQSLAGVLQGFIVLLVLLSNGLRQRFTSDSTSIETPNPTTTVEIQRTQEHG
ncbi:MAG: hypothetical protein IPO91_15525 [Chloroflexi bacterium]|nr:hypothetical protein [Chloroflexota bacterium]